jgi:hypothetical protein
LVEPREKWFELALQKCAEEEKQGIALLCMHSNRAESIDAMTHVRTFVDCDDARDAMA